MKNYILFLLLFVCLVSKAQNNLNIVPMPAEVKMGKGFFSLDKNTSIVLEGSGLEKTASFLNEYVQQFFGYKLQIAKNYTGTNAIRLNYERLDNTIAGAYHLTVDNKGIYIAGDNGAGVFYGIQTLIQLLPEKSKLNNYPLSIPQLSIKDYPRFAYRGMHLDVGRHFFPVSFIKKYIDYLAAYKYNTFHWHLTEDQGWRIEIKKYPLLTKVGGYRNGTIIGRYPGKGNDSINYGGSYTQEEIKEIVKYAADRYISIIPEIELPGHSSAAIAAYPQLSCFPNESTQAAKGTAWAGSTTGKQTQQAWGVFEDVFCPSEYTFIFLENVLDEVMQLFPSSYIHIGGDECPKEAWKRSAFCQQLIKEKNLKDEHGLQSYFIQRIEKYVNSKGRKIIGWDEILEGGLAPNAAVMSWRGEEGGIAAAQQNHDVIMTPGTYCYIDHSQSKNEDSVTIGGYLPLEKVYSYEPVPAVLNATQAKHILGAQGNVWTEYMANTSKVEYMIFPRMIALSEVLWSPKEKRDWKDFERRLPAIFEKLDNGKVNYSTAYYDLKSTIIPGENNEGVIWELESKNKNDKICISYKAGAGDVSIQENPYQLSIKNNAEYQATICKDGPIRSFISQKFTFNKATGKKITLVTEPNKSYPGNGAFTLVDGVQNEKGMSKSSEFLGFNGTDLDATIDLKTLTDVTKITLHVLDQNGSWIYLPTQVEITYIPDLDYTADQLKNFAKEIKTIDPIKDKGFKTIAIESKQQCRYIRIVAKNFGIIPSGNPGAGNPAWLFADEIEVE